VTRATLSRLLVVAAIVGLVLLLRTLPVTQLLDEAQDWADANPVLGAIVFIGATSVAAVALMPGWVSMMLAGLLFGFMPGVIYAIVGIGLGATFAMLAGRTMARTWIEKRIAGNARLTAIDEALDRQAFVIVALTRAALVIPFNVLNYAYGVTRVDPWTYAAATTVGMLPVVALYVYLGTLADDIGQILSGELQPGPETWWLAGIAVVAITLVIFVVRRTMNRVLDERLQGVQAETPALATTDTNFEE